jgi:hypothetical protein
LDCRSLPTSPTTAPESAPIGVTGHLLSAGPPSVTGPAPGGLAGDGSGAGDQGVRPLNFDPAWDPPTLISCAIYAAAHLLAHRTFAVSFVRRRGVQVLNSIVCRKPIVAANEVCEALHSWTADEAIPLLSTCPRSWF